MDSDQPPGKLADILNGLEGIEGADIDALKKIIEQNEALTREFEEHERNKPELFLAVETDDSDEVRRLIKTGADLNHRDQSGYTATIHAACRGNAEILDLLMQQDAPLDDVTRYGESVLSVLSHRGLFTLVAKVLAKGADPAPLKWDPIHHAIALGQQDELQALVAGGASLEARDGWERTPFLLALQAGDLNKAQLLLDAGADRKTTGRCGKTAMEYAIDQDHELLLDWLITQGFDIHQQDDFGKTPLAAAVDGGTPKCFRRLIEAGADWKIRSEHGFGLMNDASHPGIIKQLMELGADPGELDKEARRKLIGLPEDGDLKISKRKYRAGRFRRFGNSNPERMRVPFWEAMVHCGEDAYFAAQTFGDDSLERADAVWCHRRFGMSLTPLPDGRWVEIAGEHEDHYDPDFCIYNDVIVHDGKGGIEIYGYPEELFPPTDFHSATLAGDWIYLIGSLGYGHEPTPKETQVFRLSTRDWSMERVVTTGPSPGWIHGHAAQLEGRQIRISGGKLANEDSQGEKTIVDRHDAWLFELDTHSWHRP